MTKHILWSGLSRAGAVAGVAAALLSVGCGGSSTTIAPGDLRSRVAQSLEEGFSAYNNANGAGDQDPSTRSGEAVYDPFLELWAKPVDNGFDYFTDEACTNPGGSSRYTIETDANGNVLSRTEQTVTAGPMAPLQSTTVYRTGENGITVEMTGTSPERGNYSLTGNWNIDGDSMFEVSTQKEGEAPRKYAVLTRQNGTSKVTFDNPQWHQFTLDFNADGSGSGTVTGSSDLLPANVVWNSDGDGTVTYKDGSTRTFDNFRFDG